MKKIISKIIKIKNYQKQKVSEILSSVWSVSFLN